MAFPKDRGIGEIAYRHRTLLQLLWRPNGDSRALLSGPECVALNETAGALSCWWPDALHASQLGHFDHAALPSSLVPPLFLSRLRAMEVRFVQSGVGDRVWAMHWRLDEI